VAPERSEGATKGLRVSKYRRSRWSKCVTILECSNDTYGYILSSIEMDTAAFLHDDIVQWLLSPNDDVDVILTAAIEEYERVNVPRLHSAAPVPELNAYADDSSP